MTNTAGTATNLVASGGTPQSTTVGANFASALRITLTDAAGNPLNNQTVTFTTPLTGASAVLSSSTALTGADGMAAVTARANAIAGAYNVTAGIGGVSAAFALTNTAGPPAVIIATLGTPQSAVVGASFTSPLQVTITDASGNPAGNQAVTFAAPPTGASAVLSSGTAVTSASGVASVTARANSTAGSYAVTASAGQVSTSFSLTNTSGTGATLTATLGTPQSAAVGTTFASPLQVTLKDASGNPVGNQIVSFTGPPSGANAVLSSNTALTNTSGVASVTARANAIPGSYTITGAANGLSASFSLTNTSGTGASLTPTLGTPQSALIGNPFAIPLQVTVTDALGNPASGQNVTFTAPPSGASAVLSSNAAVTNALGMASVTATANSIAGTYAVTASLGTLTASFALTNASRNGNVALSQPATQSSTFPLSPSAGAAVDGNTDGFYFHGSVTSTNLDVNPWWQVDLGVSTSVSSIVVWNRTDCCGSRLSDYWVFVSDTPFLNSDTPATLQSRAGTFSSHQTTAPNPNTTITGNNIQGRYVRVQLSTQDYLSLAEVQVFTGVTGPLATESSMFPGSPPANAAFDGNTNGSYFGGSVTSTNLEANPWWQVDLGTSTTIGSIVIWNRTDCCASRLSDYWVFVSDTPFLNSDTPATLQSRPGTFASHQTTAPNPSSIIVVAGGGRYVRVQLSNADYLSLAEVQIQSGGLPPDFDLALGKSVAQSSTLPGTPPPGAAVDGRTDGNFFNGSVTATNLDINAWWQVDLGTSTTVGSVVVWNRTDCCSSRLSDYWVFLSNTPFLTSDTPATLQSRAGTVSAHMTSAPNPSATIPFAPAAPYRYVRVQLSGTDYLSLAEVQVFAASGPGPGPRVIAQSSTLPGTPPASAAFDGNTDGQFFDGSVTATNFENNPWWQIDLGSTAPVNAVTIWNRTDCCASRLGDYWVFVSNTPFAASDTPATLQFRAGTFSSHQTTAPNPSTLIPVGTQARYIRVQLSGADYLSLAEVQVQ